MDELIVLPEDNDLVAQLHYHGEKIPLPFSEDIFLLDIQITGRTYKDSIEQLFSSVNKGDRIRMVREPDNPTDKYAIRLEALLGDDRHVSAELNEYIVDGTIKLGYVSSMYNLMFARLMDAGKLLYGVVDSRAVVGEYPKIVIKIYEKN